MKRANLRRLMGGGRIDRNQSLSFQFNGRKLSGFYGDTLASALMANGVDVITRSFKYHRPRGIQNRGYADVNSMVQLCGSNEAPNILASVQPLYEGLDARSVNCWPSVEFDLGSILLGLSPIIPSGFYYKTFMWPSWHAFEPTIRQAAGFGMAPKEAPEGLYLSRFAHCEVLIVGAGPAGLMAALVAARSGARTIVVDEMSEPGGCLSYARVDRSEQPSADWLRQTIDELQSLEHVTCLWNATAWGYFEGNMVAAEERTPGHAGVLGRNWKIWAKQVILTSGAIERPIVFANNDLPGVMMTSAVSELIHAYAAVPGRRAVLFTNNNCAYQVLAHLCAADVEVAAIIDTRKTVPAEMHALAENAGTEVRQATVINKAHFSRKRVSGVEISPREGGNPFRIDCDLVCVSGGWNPSVHLFSQSRGSIRFDDRIAAFVPHEAVQQIRCAGGANGTLSISGSLAEGARVASDALTYLGYRSDLASIPEFSEALLTDYQIEPYWSAADGNRADKAFVDMTGDVTVFDLKLALREGYDEIEHLKRYTTTGMGLDQGKTANVNAIGILADTFQCHPSEIGTTTFRPPYAPVEFGSIAGSQSGETVLPFRHTPMTAWHKANDAVMYEAGARWRRPGYYLKPGESMNDAVERECRAVRNQVGIYDGSPLGKFVLRGSDSLKLLNILYTNRFDGLQPGRGRYGVMLNEDGLVFDDGVTFCMQEDEYLLSCSTGGALAVESKLDKLVNVEYPGLDAVITPVTSQWANATVCGPMARAMLESSDSDMDWSREALPFMHMQQGTITGIPVRVFRVSFTGELSFELNVPSRYGLALWEHLVEIGKEWEICPVGSEANHVLRVEKGFLSLAHEADGTVDPIDLGLGWLISDQKQDFVGKRAMEIRRRHHPLRQELVGLLPQESKTLISEGAPIAAARDQNLSEGFVSACVWSTACNRTIALGLLSDGRSRIGETVMAWDNGKPVASVVTQPVFYDAEGEKLRM